MRSFLIRVLFLLMAVSAIAPAAAAHGSGGWAWPVSGPVSLPFGVEYTGSGGSNVHGGLDIDGRAGDPVRACVEGEVVFSGRVPSGEGAQTVAVTVLTADGLRVTYLPLATATARKGLRVQAGDTLGTLADGGDRSITDVHLHLGVRRGETRLDPSTLLGPRSSAFASPSTAAESDPGGVVPVQGRTSTASAGSVPGGTVARSRAVSVAPQTTPASNARDLMRAELRDAIDVIRSQPRLRRISAVRDTRRFAASRALRDLTDVRSVAGRVAMAVTLAMFATGCIAIVIRDTLRSAAAASAVPAPARRTDR